MSSHPLIARVREALGPRLADDETYVLLLARRLARLEEWARGGADESWHETRAERALGRDFVRQREACWSDGDENLIREWLDPWLPASVALDRRATAQHLLAAAGRLAEIDARAETLWFFLWEVEGRWATLSNGG
jgi:hypothetical protein